MNYRRIYSALMQKARSRTLDGYFEIHHVRPKCLGGTDSPRNLVNLTPEEHYVAHQLLVKIHPQHKGLMFAIINMSGGNGRGSWRRGNKLYGWLRRRNSKLYSGKPRWSAAMKRRIGRQSKLRNRGKNHPMYGRRHSKESIARMRAARKARPPISEKTRAKMRNNHAPMSAETKAKIAAANRARNSDPNFKAKLAEIRKHARRDAVGRFAA